MDGASGREWKRVIWIFIRFEAEKGCCTEEYEALELTAMHIHKERAAIRCFLLWILNGREGYRQSYGDRGIK
jgi:hypothetical protein